MVSKQEVQVRPSVNQTDRFILIAWNPTRRIRKMRMSGESKSGSMQNWRTVKELSKKLVLELSKKWKNWKRFAVLWLRKLNGWEWMNFPDKNYRKVNLQWISWRFKFRNCKTKWTLLTTPGISMILRRRAALGCSTFPSILKNCSESSRNAQPRFLPAAWCTELI